MNRTGERVSNFTGFRSKRWVLCLLLALMTTGVQPATAQSRNDWRKTAVSPLNQAGPIHPNSQFTNTRQSLTDEQTVLLPLVFYPVQADPPVIKNGDYELGRNGDWSEAWLQVDFIITSTDLPLTPHSGQWIAWLGGVDNEANKLSQTLTLAPGSPAYLNFFFQTHSDETVCTNDTANVTVNDLAVYAFTLCDATNTSEWQPVTLDLSSFAGQAVTIAFNLTSNGSLWSSVVIDDVSLTLTP